MPLGAHARVDQQLRDSVARGGRLLFLIGATQSLNEIDRVIVRDKLQGVGYALDEIVLPDDGHNRLAGESRIDVLNSIQKHGPQNQ
jgi:hypothetical protein